MFFDGERFVLLAELFGVFDDDKNFYRKGFSSEFALCKVLSGSSNPSFRVRSFVRDCVSVGVLVFDSDGRLVLDDGKFFDVLESSRTYMRMKNIFRKYATLFID